METSLPTPLEWMDSRMGPGGAKCFLSQDQVCGHLRNVNMCKSVGPDEIHPRVLRELADVVAKAIVKTCEKSGEVSGDWKKRKIPPIFKKVKRRTLGINNLSDSPLCLEESVNRSS